MSTLDGPEGPGVVVDEIEGNSESIIAEPSSSSSATESESSLPSDASPADSSHSSPDSSRTQFSSPFILSVSDVTARGIEEHEASIFIRKFYADSFGISTWLEQLESLPSGNRDSATFRTRILDLDESEAEQLVRVYQKNTWTPEMMAMKMKANAGTEVEPDAEILKRIEEKIDEVLTDEIFSVEGETTGGPSAFLKLDSRSPKDMPFYSVDDLEIQSIMNAEMDDWVMEKYAQIKRDEEQQPEESLSFEDIMKRFPEELYVQFQRGIQNSMKVTSGRWALKLLGNSRRVYEDISRGLRFPDHFSFRLIFREWIQDVVESPQYEYRAFVRNKSLNAVSQYFADLCFPELISRKDEIREELVRFFDLIKDRIPHESYVMDFFVGSPIVPPLVIELNPFNTGAGPCLFKWSDDRELFMNGPLEFRIREKSQIEEDEEGGWREIVSAAFIPRWEDYFKKRYSSELHILSVGRKKKCLVQ